MRLSEFRINFIILPYNFVGRRYKTFFKGSTYTIYYKPRESYQFQIKVQFWRKGGAGEVITILWEGGNFEWEPYGYKKFYWWYKRVQKRYKPSNPIHIEFKQLGNYDFSSHLIVVRGNE